MFARIPELSVSELKAMLDEGRSPLLLDVRQVHEYDVANINGLLIPLHELPHRLHELDPHREDLIVVHCRSGARSAQAVQFLRQMGFEKAVNLRGGLQAWSREIDPTMPSY